MVLIIALIVLGWIDFLFPHEFDGFESNNDNSFIVLDCDGDLVDDFG